MPPVLMVRFPPTSRYRECACVVVLAVCVNVPDPPIVASAVVMSFFVEESPFETVKVEDAEDPKESEFMVTAPPERSSVGALV